MQRIVIKIGTDTLTSGGAFISEAMLKTLATDISGFLRDKKEIVLVSSGAVAQGRALLDGHGVSKRAFAAVGQPHMMARYEAVFSEQYVRTAQILLGQKDLLNKATYAPLQSTIEELLGIGIVPIINENDAVTNETSATFYENDSLAVALALSIRADTLLMLSNVDGLLKKETDIGGVANVIHKVTNVTRELLKLCEEHKSSQGSGGMIAKVKAARLAANFGITTIIVNGSKSAVIHRALRGEEIGTTFVPRAGARTLRNRDRWILAAKIATGSLTVDSGAVVALRAGKSLLAVGIRKVYGGFRKGEIIEVLDDREDALAVGIVNTDDQTLRENMEQGNLHNQEVIHADNLIIVQ